MPEFTSALYLGLAHGSDSLPGWRCLTLGVPAALREPIGIRTVAQRLARLAGCEAALLGTSTLHLFFDLFGQLARRKIAVWLDSGAYPVARWGAERAALRKRTVRIFPHYDAAALHARLERFARPGEQPVVVCDGLCPTCGRAAPLAALLDAARSAGGLLVLDDTQAFGILGTAPAGPDVYGRGGGGSLRMQRVAGPDVVLVSSLAKAFGAPIAMIGGSRTFVDSFARASETRMHNSPPSAAAIAAAARALEINDGFGDALRRRLARLVLTLRATRVGSREIVTPTPFPVQTLRSSPTRDPFALHRALKAASVHTVLASTHAGAPAVRVQVTARHSVADIDQLASALEQGSEEDEQCRTTISGGECSSALRRSSKKGHISSSAREPSC